MATKDLACLHCVDDSDYLAYFEEEPSWSADFESESDNGAEILIRSPSICEEHLQEGHAQEPDLETTGEEHEQELEPIGQEWEEDPLKELQKLFTQSETQTQTQYSVDFSQEAGSLPATQQNAGQEEAEAEAITPRTYPFDQLQLDQTNVEDIIVLSPIADNDNVLDQHANNM